MIIAIHAIQNQLIRISGCRQIKRPESNSFRSGIGGDFLLRLIFYPWLVHDRPFGVANTLNVDDRPGGSLLNIKANDQSCGTGCISTDAAISNRNTEGIISDLCQSVRLNKMRGTIITDICSIIHYTKLVNSALIRGKNHIGSILLIQRDIGTACANGINVVLLGYTGSLGSCSEGNLLAGRFIGHRQLQLR